MTCAPNSARIRVQVGPARTRVKSSTLMFSSGFISPPQRLPYLVRSQTSLSCRALHLRWPTSVRVHQRAPDLLLAHRRCTLFELYVLSRLVPTSGLRQAAALGIAMPNLNLRRSSPSWITPQRSNTSGLYRRPSMAISLARAGPALSVNRCTAPSNGASPIATSTEPICADWAATIKSLARASSNPPPSTAP